MSLQDELALNQGYPEPGSEFPDYCRGDRQIVGSKKHKKKSKRLISDEQIEKMKIVREEMWTKYQNM